MSKQTLKWFNEQKKVIRTDDRGEKTEKKVVNKEYAKYFYGLQKHGHKFEEVTK